MKHRYTCLEIPNKSSAFVVTSSKVYSLHIFETEAAFLNISSSATRYMYHSLHCFL